ncbi:MobA/MobL family protein [Frigidibacter sp.]|uniref:MobA/MobL family protein n=1 Tax=Frigidibacter sp. TaxID=2586418 RepID=UPI002735825A|nr:MobA/MobL family protein [Frigidibacter sp.]MDP3342821.1 MobA/MobL family protein [Frigidibacter sp.]
MAIARLSMKVGKAGKAGPHAAYIARTGRHADRLERGEKLEATEAGNMPAWAQSNPLAFWEAADACERKGGTTYREMEIALPRELSPEQRLELVRDWVASEIGDRHAYQWSIHTPKAADGGEQPHVHLMFSERQCDGIERDPDQYFKRYNAKAPEKGGARKGYGPRAGETLTREERAEDLKALRSRWGDLCNAHLERAAAGVAIDMRSNAEQGAAEPEAKQLPSQWRGDGRAAVLEFRAAKAEAAEATAAVWQQMPEPGRLIELERERVARAERQRLEAMPLAELRQHVAGLKSPGAQALLEAMPEPQALLGRLKAVSTAEAKAKGELAKHEPAYQAWQKAHPVRAWLHRKGLLKHAHAGKVEGWLEQQRQELAKAEKERAAVLAEGKELGARLMPKAQAEHERREAACATAMPLLERREQAERERQQRALAEHLQAEKARRQERGKDRGPGMGR